jgi:hypothetical protein
MVETAVEWGDLIGALHGKLLGETRAEDGGQRTRFNDVGRAWRSSVHVEIGFWGAVVAETVPNKGVVLTATTDPKRFDSVLAAAGGLLKDARLLRGYVKRSVEAETVPAVTVTEPTQTGIPHAHIALFGVDEESLPSARELRNYWSRERGRGEQLDIQPIRADDGEGVPVSEAWTWAGTSPTAAGGCPPVQYLQEGPKSLLRTAVLDADDVSAVASAYRKYGGAPMNAETAAGIDRAVAAKTGIAAAAVRQASWYWATGLKAATRPSPALREAAARDDGWDDESERASPNGGVPLPTLP